MKRLRTCTPEKLALMVELLPTAESLRDIAAIVDLDKQVVQQQVRPFLAIMKLAGTLPPCRCGKDRFHRYGCSIVTGKSEHTTGLMGTSAAEAGQPVDKRKQVLTAILDGVRFVQIEANFGMGRGSARWYLRHLTPRQQAMRKQMERDRRSDRLRPIHEYHQEFAA